MMCQVADFGPCVVNVRLLIPFFVPRTDDTLGEFERFMAGFTHRDWLANSPAVPAVKDKVLERCGDDALWQAVETKADIKAEQEVFYPHISRLFGGHSPTLMRSWVLGDVGYQLLDGAFGKFGKGIDWQLPSGAKQRIDYQDECVNVSFCRSTEKKNTSKPKIYLFGLGCGLLELSLSLPKETTFGLVQEFMYAFTRSATRLCWADGGKSFELGELVAGLLGQNQQKNTLQLFDFQRLRYFSYVTLGVGEGAGACVGGDTLQAMAFSLAHRQTSEYLPILTQFENGIYQPFANIVHAMSIEGGATVLCVNESEYSKNFIANPLKSFYLPMVMLSYVEFVYLVNVISRASPTITLHKKDKSTILALEKIREELLAYRFYYWFSKVSHLTQHNDFYKKWRIMMDSDTLMQEILDDVQQIDTYLTYCLAQENQAIEERHNKRMGILGIIATGALSLIGVFGTNFKMYDELSLTSGTTVWTLVLGVLGVLGVLVTLVAVGIYLWALKKDK